MSIHERIKAIRVEAGMSQEDFATSIGLKRGNYAQIELGKQYPTLETIKAIVRIYNKAYEWVIDDDFKGPSDYNPNYNVNYNPTEKVAHIAAEPEVQYLPQVVTVDTQGDEAITVVGIKAAAGYLNGFGDPEYIADLPTLSLPGYRGGLHRGFEIRGNSMPPIHPGAISIGRYVESLSEIRNRHVYIILSKNEGLVLKRVINRPDEQMLILISDNPNKREFPNYTISYDEVHEIWYWRGALIREIPDPASTYERMNDMESRLTLIEDMFNQIRGKSDLVIKQNKRNT